MPLDLSRILSEPVDWRFKGFPEAGSHVTIGTVGEQGWRVLGDDLLFPAMVLKEQALEHNLALMADYCRQHGVGLAPHGKTAMSPQLLQRQLDAGAWGVTVATTSQACTYRAFGADRILIANEVVEPAALAWIASELDRDPSFELLCLVDSPQGVELMDAALRGCGAARRLGVLVELGVPGGRNGCRTVEEAIEVALAVRRTSTLRLAGVEGYEGVIGASRDPATIDAIDEYLRRVRRLTEELARVEAFAGSDQIIVTAGGSSFFDRVVELLGSGWERISPPVQVLLRSGAYATHDDGFYARLSALREQLRPALEVWSRVLSRPEPGLVILGFGRRDAPFDIQLPVPRWIFSRQTGSRPAGERLEVFALNDQHAFVRVDPADELAPGDLVGCGIVHPCTAFDKWPLIPLVDEEYRVIGALRTYF